MLFWLPLLFSSSLGPGDPPPLSPVPVASVLNYSLSSHEPFPHQSTSCNAHPCLSFLVTCVPAPHRPHSLRLRPLFLFCPFPAMSPCIPSAGFLLRGGPLPLFLIPLPHCHPPSSWLTRIVSSPLLRDLRPSSSFPKYRLHCTLTLILTLLLRSAL